MTGAWLAICSRSCVIPSPSAPVPSAPCRSAIIPAASGRAQARRMPSSSAASSSWRSSAGAPKSSSSSATACGSGRPAQPTTSRPSSRARGRTRFSSRYSRVSASPSRESVCVSPAAVLTAAPSGTPATCRAGPRPARGSRTRRRTSPPSGTSKVASYSPSPTGVAGARCRQPEVEASCTPRSARSATGAPSADAVTRKRTAVRPARSPAASTTPMARARALCRAGSGAMLKP